MGGRKCVCLNRRVVLCFVLLSAIPRPGLRTLFRKQRERSCTRIQTCLHTFPLLMHTHALTYTPILQCKSNTHIPKASSHTHTRKHAHTNTHTHAQIYTPMIQCKENTHTCKHKDSHSKHTYTHTAVTHIHTMQLQTHAQPKYT